MSELLRKNWFMLGLIVIALVTLADTHGFLTGKGLWLKTHHGPEFIIVLIFFLSGLGLDTGRIRAGLSDLKGTLTALFLIFFVAPLLALPFTFLQLETGILVGFFLVAVMPCTLSSGVVMTGAAGGNMAHALLITIIANSLAVITIPFSLGFLLSLTGDSRTIEIDQISIMVKIATLVLLPLIAGLILRNLTTTRIRPFLPYTGICNQISVLTIVWIAFCGSRQVIAANFDIVLPVIGMIFGFHLALILAGVLMIHCGAIEKGRRESVILMGGQKTLALSVILQVSLFPEYGVALVICVLHQIIHLIMDAFLVQYLKEKK